MKNHWLFAYRGKSSTRADVVLAILAFIGLVGFWFIALPLGFVLSEGIIFPGLAPGVYGYWAAQTLGLTLVAGAMALRLWHISANSQKVLKLAGT